MGCERGSVGAPNKECVMMTLRLTRKSKQTKKKKKMRLRGLFCDFFAARGHVVLPSSPLVPLRDPSLLFTSAGMVQFKARFLSESTGEENEPANVATVQRCMRAGGKHNDLENVGRTPRHHTFFEMLGNFSFGHARHGSYFKYQAIAMAWSLLTGDLGIDPARLVVTVLEGDEESELIWRSVLGPLYAEGKILRMGKEDNFWSMGDEPGTPCGPCSEIYFKQDNGELLEIWNLVFMQDRVGGGKLKYQSVDTGMGLERLASVIERVPSNYDTKAFSGLLKSISDRIGVSTDSVACRVIADHARAAVFLACDGVIPGNVGKGHVLRRIIRRASRFVYLSGGKEPILSLLIPEVFDSVDHHYAELENRNISGILKSEEESFLSLLPTGCEYLERHLSKLGAGEKLSGDLIFQLNDAFGFPVDLTAQICEEKGIAADLEGARIAQEKHRLISRVSKSSDSQIGTFGKCGVFVGPDNAELTKRSRVVGIGGEESDWITIDPCPFFPESGGQVGDVGLLCDLKDGGLPVRVLDCQNYLNLGAVIRLEEGGAKRVSSGDLVTAVVDSDHRSATSQHHTATHLVQTALKALVSDSIRQAGSKVGPNGLRFDFVDPENKIGDASVLAEQVTAWVRQAAAKSVPISTEQTSLDRATKELNATALFGEKYGSVVRVVNCESLSVELCGGTHVSNTRQLAPFEVVSIRSVGSGVKRLEAKVGAAAELYSTQREAAALASQASEKEKMERKKQEEKEVVITQSVDRGNVRLSWAENDVEFSALKLAAHKLRKLDGSRTHVVLSLDKEEKNVFVAVAAAGERAEDARAVLKRLGATGGGNAEFAAGVAKQATLEEVTEKIN